MFGIHLNKKKKRNNNDSLIYIIKDIKEGDADLREQFIGDNVPYIVRVISNVLGIPVDDKNSEEYSIGLSAFNEAIDSFDFSRDVDFFNYSYLVIKSRLIDFIRKNKKHNKTLPFSYFEEYMNVDDSILLISGFSKQLDNIEIRQELLIFEKSLNVFEISLRDLVICSPKHKDTRIQSIKIARVIADNDEIYSKLVKKRYLPLKDLLKHTKVSKKTVERNRKFIIAVALILRSNLEDIKEFVVGFERRCKYE